MSIMDQERYGASHNLDEPTKEAKQVINCLKDTQQVLYLECTKLAKLSSSLKLLHLKCHHK